MDFTLYNEAVEQVIKSAHGSNLLALIAPLNAKVEKQKFIDSSYSYNPQFKYKRREPYLINLKRFNLPDSNITELIINKKRFLDSKSDLLENRDSEMFTIKSIDLYGSTNKDILEYAVRIAKQDSKASQSLEFDQILSLIKQEVLKSGLKADIEVIQNPLFRNKVTASSDKIRISREYIADEDELVDLVNHELNTHIRRNFNGSRHPFNLFHYGSAKNLETEEGLATLMGHAFKKDKLLKHPALLYIAVDTALKEDFKSTFECIFSFCNDTEIAWSYTLRAKRGISDTSKPGAFTKDKYFEWAINTAREVLKKPHLLDTAFLGKGTLEELYKYSSMGKGNYKPLDSENILEILRVNNIEAA